MKPEEEEPKYKFYQIKEGGMISSDKFKYTLQDIQFENIMEGIHDDDLRTAILNPSDLKSKMDEENLALFRKCINRM